MKQAAIFPTILVIVFVCPPLECTTRSSNHSSPPNNDNSHKNGRSRNMNGLCPLEEKGHNQEAVLGEVNNGTHLIVNVNVNMTSGNHCLSDELENLLEGSELLTLPNGIQAHFNYCGDFCDGTRKLKVHSRPYCLRDVQCKSCHCDDLCHIYGDCCPEKERMGELQNIPSPKYSCFTVLDVCDVRVTVQMVTKCLGTEALCEECDPHFPTPVISPTTSIVYCSMNCSLCNRERQAVALDRKFLDREMFVLPFNGTQRRCDDYESDVKNNVIVCDEPRSAAHVRLVDLCLNYTYPVFTKHASYKNLFCALCKGIKPTCIQTQRLSVIASEGLSLLTRTVKPDSKRKCKRDYWFDIAKTSCRPVWCHMGRIWARRRDLLCDMDQKNSRMTQWYGMLISFKLLTNISGLLTAQDFQQVKNRLINHLADVMQRLDVVTYALAVNFQVTFESIRVLAFVEFVSNKSENDKTFEKRVICMFMKSKWVLNETDISSLLEFEMSFNENNETNFKPCVLSSSYDNGSCCRYESIVEWERRISNSFSVDKRNKIVLDQTTPFANVVLNSSEFSIDVDVVVLTYANVTLELKRVKINGSSLVVPLEHLIGAYKEAGLVDSPELDIEVILSQVFLTISIISLIFVLTTYSTFPQLRSLPGINNMFLASWLLIGQMLLLTIPTRTEIPDLCRVLGALLHYSWLVVVFWMSACSFHMFHVFVVLQSSLEAAHSHAWYIKRYVTLTQLLPLVIVATVIIARWVHSEGQDIGYGGDVCYLNTPLLVGLGFVLPLTACVAANIVLLALTARALMLMKRQPIARSTHVSDSQNVSVYMKLSSLTGVCWVVALIAEIPGCWWLKYVSIVFNGLQGLHLALSYTANKRVIRMWCERFRKKFGNLLESSDRKSSSTRKITQTTR